MSKYFSPFTDIGFKKLFAEEANKDILIDFLNTILPSQHLVEALTFCDPETLGPGASERRSVFDIYCENPEHEQFVVEMQTGEPENFLDRSMAYASYPICDPTFPGAIDLKRQIYIIAVLDFLINEKDDDDDIICEVSLQDQSGSSFCSKLKFFYVQLPLFQKTETELETRRDQWFYFLKNLSSWEDVPTIFKEDPIFQKAFRSAEFASLSEKQRADYDQDLKDYQDYLASKKTED